MEHLSCPQNSVLYVELQYLFNNKFVLCHRFIIPPTWVNAAYYAFINRVGKYTNLVTAKFLSVQLLEYIA